MVRVHVHDPSLPSFTAWFRSIYWCLWDYHFVIWSYRRSMIEPRRQNIVWLQTTLTKSHTLDCSMWSPFSPPFIEPTLKQFGAPLGRSGHHVKKTNSTSLTGQFRSLGQTLDILVVKLSSFFPVTIQTTSQFDCFVLIGYENAICLHVERNPSITFPRSHFRLHTLSGVHRSARPLGRLNVAVPSEIKLFGILPGPAHFGMSAPDSSAGSPDSSSIPLGRNLRFQWRDDRKWGAANPALVNTELKDGERAQQGRTSRHRTACQGCSPCMDLAPRLSGELKKGLTLNNGGRHGKVFSSAGAFILIRWGYNLPGAECCVYFLSLCFLSSESFSVI